MTLPYGLFMPVFLSAAWNVAIAQETITVADKQTLAKRIEPLGKEAAELIRRPETRVDEFRAPFFTRGGVYQATNPAPRRPIAFTFGVAPPNYAVMLPNNPEGFMDLATHAGIDVSSDENRLLYAQIFLMATRDFSRRFQVLHEVSEIERIARPTEREAKRYQEILGRFKAQVQQPRLLTPGSPEAIFFALIGQDLFEIKLKIANDGRVQRSDTLLDADLPIAFAK
jgi:hypothetical protein